MSGERTIKWDWAIRGTLAAQALVGVIALTTAIYAPRAGQAVAIWPMDKTGAYALTALVSEPGTRLLARGNLDGSLVVTGSQLGFFEGLFRHHLLAINASAPGCAPRAIAGTRISKLPQWNFRFDR